MADQPLTTEAIALTEKKMDMTLDDIIKLYKTANPKKQRASKFVDDAGLDKSLTVRRFMDTQSSFRQGAISQRRSNFQENQFPLAIEAARKAAAIIPTRNRAFNRGRPSNLNTSRVGVPDVQKVAASTGGFTVEKPLRQGHEVVPKQKTQTLDSLFANMKEQRLQRNGSRRNGGGQTRVPWARNRARN